MKNITKIGIAFCLLIASSTYAQKAKIISGFNHVESVVTDGKFIYAADIGKELNPTCKQLGCF